MFKFLGNVIMTLLKLLFLPIVLGLFVMLIAWILFGAPMTGFLIGGVVGLVLSFKKTFH